MSHSPLWRAIVVRCSASQYVWSLQLRDIIEEQLLMLLLLLMLLVMVKLVSSCYTLCAGSLSEIWVSCDRTAVQLTVRLYSWLGPATDSLSHPSHPPRTLRPGPGHSGALLRRPVHSSRSQIPLLCDSPSAEAVYWHWEPVMSSDVREILSWELRGREDKVDSIVMIQPGPWLRPGGGHISTRQTLLI